MEKKALVAYFSATGTTERAAQALAEAAKADIYEIKPAVPYKKGDLNWMNPLARSTKEMNGKLPHPEIEGKCENLADYDVVFVGFPIWWYVAPTIINTFLEKHDFSGKTIVLFATSGGSGFGKTVSKLQGSVSDSTVIKEGRVMRGSVSAQELTAWVDSLGL